MAVFERDTDMLMETEYQVDDTLVQQYFPMEVVTEGIFE